MNEDFKVIICGSRDFNDYELLREKCNLYLSNKRNEANIVIVSGNARGTDKLGERYSTDEGFRLEIYKADWDKYGKRAGYRRNEQMLEVGNAVIAFWDGESRGTKHMIDIAENKGLLVKVVRYNDSAN